MIRNDDMKRNLFISVQRLSQEIQLLAAIIDSDIYTEDTAITVVRSIKVPNLLSNNDKFLACRYEEIKRKFHISICHIT